MKATPPVTLTVSAGGTATAAPSRLQTRMAEQAAEEQARAIRELLASPLLTAEANPAAFDLVRRHAGPLRQWFDEQCGWALHVEPRRGWARLAKTGSDPDPTRPARRLRSTRAPFDRRRYAMLCLVCAELSRPGAMTTVGLLAERVRAASAADPAVATFDSAHRDERAAFVDALKLLEHLGVVAAVDGATDSFVHAADAKVLYAVDEGRLARLLACPTPPARLGDEPDLDALVREPRYGDAPSGDPDVAESQRNLWLRHSLTRRVLDDPVVHLDDLTEPQRAYLRTPTGRRLVRQAVAAAGFVLEERAEGMLAVDPDAVATDGRFPDEHSHAKHAALLLLDALCGAGPAGAGLLALTAQVDGLLRRFPAWARAYQSDGGAARLAADAVDVLCAFGLADRDGGRVVARPAAARYAATRPQPESAPASPDGPVPRSPDGPDPQSADGPVPRSPGTPRRHEPPDPPPNLFEPGARR